MTETNEFPVKPSSIINPFAAAALGVLVGAGMGAATTKILSDKKLRDKLMHTVSITGEKFADYLKSIMHETRRRT